MPNNVYSKISLYGDISELDNVKRSIRTEATPEDSEKHLDFEKIVPMPSDVYKGSLGYREQELYGNMNWYDWSIENWGTKWNAYGQPRESPEIFCASNTLRFIKDNKNTKAVLSYTFETAWSPCFPVMKALSRKFPEVLIRYVYIDEGGSFSAICYLRNGEILEDKDVTERKAQNALDKTDDQILIEMKKYLKKDVPRMAVGETS